MSDTEQRVREALRAEVDGYDGDPEAWHRVGVGVHRRHVRRRVSSALVVTALLVAGGVVVLASRADRTQIVAGPGTISTPTSVSTPADTAPPTTTAPSETTTVPPPPSTAVAFDGIWPFASGAELERYLADPGSGEYLDVTRTAVAFARDFLMMPDPVVDGGPSEVAPGSTGSVSILPSADSPVVTTVELRRIGAAYVVIGASSDNIRVDEPIAGATVTSPIAVHGISTAFEATILAQVRSVAGAGGETTALMGGGNGTLAPFSGEVAGTLPPSDNAALVFFTRSPKDGSVLEATVVRISTA
jgi:hypothetical protein